MTFYHASKDAALEAGVPYEGFWHVRAELEPYNGWVLILTPRSKDVFNWPLAPLMQIAELDLTRFARLAIKPEGRKMSPKITVAVPKAPKPRQTAPKPAPVLEIVGEQTVKPAWAAKPAAATPAPVQSQAPVSGQLSAPAGQTIKPAWQR